MDGGRHPGEVGQGQDHPGANSARARPNLPQAKQGDPGRAAPGGGCTPGGSEPEPEPPGVQHWPRGGGDPWHPSRPPQGSGPGSFTWQVGVRLAGRRGLAARRSARLGLGEERVAAGEIHQAQHVPGRAGPAAARGRGRGQAPARCKLRGRRQPLLRAAAFIAAAAARLFRPPRRSISGVPEGAGADVNAQTWTQDVGRGAPIRKSLIVTRPLRPAPLASAASGRQPRSCSCSCSRSAPPARAADHGHGHWGTAMGMDGQGGAGREVGRHAEGWMGR